MTKKTSLLLGAHMSGAGGLHKALEAGASIGCTTLQLFTKSNRQWHAKELEQQEIEQFKQAHKATKIDPIVAHATYLINIGSSNNETSAKSTVALSKELMRCDQLGIAYLVLHPGSHVSATKQDITQTEQECLDRIVLNLDTAFDKSPGSTMILLEIMAGQGSAVCYSFEHLAYILKNARHKERLGICFDTCHAFVAGYDFRDKKSYEAVWHDFDTIIGLNHLKVIHMNDSKKGLGSHVDRHEDIGKGELGIDAFKLIMNDPRFQQIAKILETPKEDLNDDVRNLDLLRSLIK